MKGNGLTPYYPSNYLLINPSNMFIIKYTSTIQGVKKTTFHSSLKLNDNKSTVNTYCEYITTDKKEALQFFTKEEAKRIGSIFNHPTLHKSRVINAR